uniref:Uncharacterized protein n=1 Tax=Odontella aurita TaxID=265563 RepID=A0A7S4HKX1_9STRA|mmetsp:Transcript_11642/g.34218  ORF Transcript_11642/g.34218 Transcript_11642/m.34218 type:complete len:481 (+) Transcript_11642:344-1786(+)
MAPKKQTKRHPSMPQPLTSVNETTTCSRQHCSFPSDDVHRHRTLPTLDVGGSVVRTDNSGAQCPRQSSAIAAGTERVGDKGHRKINRPAEAVIKSELQKFQRHQQRIKERAERKSAQNGREQQCHCTASPSCVATQVCPVGERCKSNYQAKAEIIDTTGPISARLEIPTRLTSETFAATSAFQDQKCSVSKHAPPPEVVPAIGPDIAAIESSFSRGAIARSNNQSRPRAVLPITSSSRHQHQDTHATHTQREQIIQSHQVSAEGDPPVPSDDSAEFGLGPPISGFLPPEVRHDQAAQHVQGIDHFIAEMLENIVEGQVVNPQKAESLLCLRCCQNFPISCSWKRGIAAGLLVALITVAVSVAVVFSPAKGVARNVKNKGITSQPFAGSNGFELSTRPPAPELLQSDRFMAIGTALAPALDEDEMRDVNSPQHKAVTWLADLDILLVSPDDVKNLTQRFALATFFFSTEGELWHDNLNMRK